MPRLILYIAASLDGYIARPDGAVDWLEAFNTPGEDYGYADFYATLSDVALGGVTYRQALGFGAWPYPGVTAHVFSRSQHTAPAGVSARFYAGDVFGVLTALKRTARKDIWLAGGADLVTQCLQHGLIDETILSYIPLFLGAGIPLAHGNLPPGRLTLLSHRVYAAGVVQVHYRHAVSPAV